MAEWKPTITSTFKSTIYKKPSIIEEEEEELTYPLIGASGTSINVRRQLEAAGQTIPKDLGKRLFPFDGFTTPTLQQSTSLI